MNMDEFEPDSPNVRAKLGAYWERLGFKPSGSSDLYLRNLERLPKLSDVLKNKETDERE